MSMYLVAAFVLLVVMLFLVLRPFLLASVEPLPVSGPDGSGTARGPVATAQRAAPAPRAAPTAAVAAPTGPATATVAESPVATGPAPAAETDVRTAVEAAIAARKAALRARHCTSCDATIGDGDAFCRSCGAKVSA